MSLIKCKKGVGVGVKRGEGWRPSCQIRGLMSRPQAQRGT